MDVLLGIDLGTQGVRSGIYTVEGELIAGSQRRIGTRFPQPDWAEQDPFEVLSAVMASASEAARQAGRAPVACAIASTAVTALPVGPDDEPIGAALLWMDTRAAEQATRINATSHPVLWYTGGAVSPEWMLPKALWLAQHDADRYRAARRVVDVHDWLLHRLTGQWSLARATVTAEWCYDACRETWPLDLLSELGIGGLVSGWQIPILAPGHSAGALTATAADELGLPTGVPVVQGLMDSYAAALAADVFQPGRVAVSVGTSSAYIGLIDKPVSDPRLLGPVRDAFGAGTWAAQGGQTTAAATVQWFCDQLAPGVSPAVLDEEAARLPPGADGLWALDTWQGCRTPHRDPAMRGAFGGLTLSHTRGHLYRALLEAVTFGGRSVLETLWQAGVRTDEVVLSGGAARSPLWLQMFADVFGRPIRRLTADQPVTLGAAMCAAVGAGRYPDLRAAAAAMARISETIWPDPARHAVYQPLYTRYLSELGR
jgi:sugar (pentulose or hexulose) kinase